MSALETVDLDGIEILATGGPVHGRGSAAGGDSWTSEQLRELAKANSDLADELRPPAKLGHGDSGDPAVGWLENIRINEDGSRLLADVKSVPKRLADLIKAKAYRTRSVELSRVTSQRTGRRYDLAVSGLAWLGASLPAVRTLDDVVALYADDHVELRRVYVSNSTTQDEAALAAPREFVSAALQRGAINVDQALEHLVAFGDDPARARSYLQEGDEAQRREIARSYGLELDDVPAAFATADPDLAEREQIARMYNLDLADVP